MGKTLGIQHNVFVFSFGVVFQQYNLLVHVLLLCFNIFTESGPRQIKSSSHIVRASVSVITSFLAICLMSSTAVASRNFKIHAALTNINKRAALAADADPPPLKLHQ